MADVIEVNCETGEVTTRPQTDEEIAATKAAADQAAADAKLSAQAKLQKLGLTGAEITALLG